MTAKTLPDHARAWILAVEGGYVNDPNDPGGETNWGISKRAHPDIDIRNLTEDAAVEIYRREYWIAVRADELPAPLALAVFDAAVLQGVKAAVTTLQRALVNLGLDDIYVDGLMGPATLHSARLAAQADLGETLAELLSLRSLAYLHQALADEKKKRFLRGWGKRLFKLQAACLRLAAGTC